MLGVLLALLAAGANAAASVLQRAAARREPESRAFSIGLLWDLAHRPVWIAGIATIVVGFLLQAAALANGAIALVQPLLVLELPFTLLLASRVFGSGLDTREWLAILAMAAGLAALLTGLAPTDEAVAPAGLVRWLTGLTVTIAVVVVLVLLGLRGHGSRRAALLGAATGLDFGLTAVLVKVVTAAYTEGIDAVFVTWQTYLIFVTGPAGFFLLQNALEAGSLVASQPAMTLTNPAAAIAWGIAILGEPVRSGGWLVLAFAGAGAIAAGTVLLARSELFHTHHGKPPPAASRRDRAERRGEA
ncbi:MAG TPA: DMT family transporter [Streptosporangiales bacterium]